MTEPRFEIFLRPWRGGATAAVVSYHVGSKLRTFTRTDRDRKEAIRSAIRDLLAKGHRGETYRVTDADGFLMRGVVASSFQPKPKQTHGPSLPTPIGDHRSSRP